MLAHFALAALLAGPATSSGTTLTVTSARNVTDAFGRVNCALVLAGSNSSRHDITLTLINSTATATVNGAVVIRRFLPTGSAPHVIVAGAPVRMLQAEYIGFCLPTVRYSFELSANGRTLNHTHPAVGQPPMGGNRVMLGDLSAPFR